MPSEFFEFERKNAIWKYLMGKSRDSETDSESRIARNGIGNPKDKDKPNTLLQVVKYHEIFSNACFGRLEHLVWVSIFLTQNSFSGSFS
jgi:hypothetical protein